MPVPSPRIRIAFNRRIRRHWHRPRIALVAVGCKVDIGQRLRPAHHHIRNRNIRPLILPAPKIRAQPSRSSNKVDNRRRVRIHRCPGNIRVPKAGASEQAKPIQTSPLPQADSGARSRPAASSPATVSPASATRVDAARCRTTATTRHHRGQPHQCHGNPAFRSKTHTNSFRHLRPNYAYESGRSTHVIGTCTSGGRAAEVRANHPSTTSPAYTPPETLLARHSSATRSREPSQSSPNRTLAPSRIQTGSPTTPSAPRAADTRAQY